MFPRLTVVSSTLHLPDFPFRIGVFDHPHNPEGIPDTYPFTTQVDPEIAAIRQKHTPGLAALLKRAYQLGLDMGTPASDSESGCGYAHDFIRFVRAATSGTHGRALEIGAGAGYISYKLLQGGFQVDSIEPGAGYKASLERYGIEVIDDFFPSPCATGPYDLIVSYNVLEHIADPVPFLKEIALRMRPKARLVLAVPDCTFELFSGDPGMLVHEHFYYHTRRSLRRCLALAGFRCRVTRSGHGRVIYAVAELEEAAGRQRPELTVGATEQDALDRYASRCRTFIESARRYVDEAVERGSLGVFIPGRALAIIPQDERIRFFDDSRDLHGKYYPPFGNVIERRQDLIERPTRQLLIMSRTFGETLRAELRDVLPDTTMIMNDDLASAGLS